MSHDRIDLGALGETIAAAYLEEKGYRIIDRNYRHKSGEIDIIARDDGTFVFVEVKTRSDERYGHPTEAVTRQKQRQLSNLALHYLASHDLLDAAARFDVVGVIITGKEPEISHLVSAFEYSGIS